jgi:chemotaxis response regulator CheB
MTRRRVLLLGQHSILTKGVQNILEHAEVVELVGVAPLETEEETAIINRLQPDVVVLTGEDSDPPVIETCLARLLKAHPDLPVIVTSAAEDTLYVYTSRRGLAQSPDLIAAIVASPARGPADAAGQ